MDEGASTSTPSPEPTPTPEPLRRAQLSDTTIPGLFASALLGEGGGNGSCGNTNVSVRISSPGDDGGVSQSDPGGCGNTNISIRIDSPGSNGPVSQDAGDSPPAGPGRDPGPRAGLVPRTFGAQLARRSTRLAWSLVAQAGVKVNRAPRRTSRRSGQTTGVTVHAAAHAAAVSASAGGTKAAASAHVSIKASHHAQHARRSSKHAARIAPASRTHRFTAATPGLSFPRLRRADSGLSLGGAFLIALLAAMLSYLLVPPLRGSLLGPSVKRWSRGPLRR